MHRIRPKKFLGQHFLKDHNIAKKIVESLTCKTDKETILEIGPGTGVLTDFLVQKNFSELILVELDKESISLLKKKYENHHMDIIEGDFLKLNIQDITNREIHIIGNFPYYISSQIFFKILEQRTCVKEVVCMIQKEVANRICAGHGNRTYGILTVLIGAYYEPKLLFEVPPAVFHPPPKVDSAVVRLKRKKNLQLDCDEMLFRKIVKQAFQNRRKTLRNALKPIFLPEDLTKIEIFSQRAEQLSIEDFIQLTLKIQNWKK